MFTGALFLNIVAFTGNI